MKAKVFLPATLWIIALVILVTGAEAEPSIRVHRQLEVKNKWGEKDIWFMDVTQATGLSLWHLRNTLYGSNIPATLNFSNGDAASQVFDRFDQWTATAKNNHVEPFSKAIAEKIRFEFSGTATLMQSYRDPLSERAVEARFTEEDVQKFKELLKEYPAAEQELRDRLAKAAKESNLFK